MRDDLLRLIDAWRAAKRAAASDDYAPRNHEYARRADAYRLVLRMTIYGAYLRDKRKDAETQIARIDGVLRERPDSGFLAAERRDWAQAAYTADADLQKLEAELCTD